jgi:hypothetical protein
MYDYFCNVTIQLPLREVQYSQYYKLQLQCLTHLLDYVHHPRFFKATMFWKSVLFPSSDGTILLCWTLGKGGRIQPWTAAAFQDQV